jgi:hypothetical protein
MVKLCRMETFRVTADESPSARARDLWRFLLILGVYWALVLSRMLLWPSPYERSESLPEKIFWTLFQSVFFATAMNLFFLGFRTYELSIDEDQITMAKGRFKRSIRKEHARMVLETKGGPFSPPGLTISRYGRFGTRMLGSIFVPKTLPQYEYIKELAMSWKTSTQC